MHNIKKHVDPATVRERNGGAHFSYLCGILSRNNGGGGFVVGNGLTIADIQVQFMEVCGHI